MIMWIHFKSLKQSTSDVTSFRHGQRGCFGMLPGPHQDAGAGVWGWEGKRQTSSEEEAEEEQGSISGGQSVLSLTDISRLDRDLFVVRDCAIIIFNRIRSCWIS